ncbi:MAG: Uma2 family endonuclease [Isosphaeraceae bacterium]|nr:Uma2 family endonuclease [Isosphaeraceae bacterium]
MAVGTQHPTTSPPDEPSPPRLSVEAYHRLVRDGALNEDDRVELLDGLLVAKRPTNPSHRIATRKARVALERILPAGWYADEQKSITLTASEPEPDVAVVRGDTSDYQDRHPGPRDVGLVVEVSDTTLAQDQGFKKRLYAAAGIPCYWVVNIPARRLEVYADPTGPSDAPGYHHRSEFGADDTVVLVLDGQLVRHIRVSDLLP